jgi:hypothetical protein
LGQVQRQLTLLKFTEDNMSEMRAAGTFIHGPDIEKEGQESFCPSFAFCARNLVFAGMKCVKSQSRPSGH